MRFTADFTQYKDRFGGYVAPGRYLATIEDAEGDQSKAGNDMVVLTLRIRTPGDFQNTVLIDRLTLTEKALFRVVNFLEVLTGKPVPRKAMTLDTDKWLGRQIGIEVEDREYNGRTSSNVTTYLRPSVLFGDQPAETEDLPEYSPDSPSDVQDSLAPEAPAPQADPAPEATTAAQDVSDTGEVNLDELDL